MATTRNPSSKKSFDLTKPAPKAPAGEAAPATDAEAFAPATPPATTEHASRFQFFIIDSGWKSTAAKVLRDNFRMIREFQNSDPLYVLSRQQSVELIRKNPKMIGKDPILLVHDLHAKGGRGEVGYHGFRLNLGLIRNEAQALEVLQEFLSFVANHRQSADIEEEIRKHLHRAGIDGAIEVIREGAKDLAGG
jgi:hypothetical protein